MRILNKIKDSLYFSSKSINKKVVLITIFTIIIIRIFVIDFKAVPTSSMHPTINPKSVIFYSRWDKDNVERGDIVVFTYNGKTLVKRVIGLPGDLVTLYNGKLFINEIEQPEDYVVGKNNVESSSIKKAYVIPEGKMFTLGDNRDNSWDSRYWADPFPYLNSVQGVYKFKLF